MRNGENWRIDPEKRLESRNRLHYNVSDSERIELVAPRRIEQARRWRD